MPRGARSRATWRMTSQEKPDTEDAALARMNEALKKMMSTPHETQKDMIERRRRQGEIKPRKKQHLFLE